MQNWRKFLGRIFWDGGGFTMVELVIVVSIIGLLAAIAVPSYSAQANKAKVKAAQAELKNIKAAIEFYYNDETGGNGKYPLASNSGNDGIKSVLESYGVRWGSIKDPWGKPYRYSVDSATSPADFRLECGGPDGLLGNTSTDDIVCGATFGEPRTGQTASKLPGGECNSGSDGGT